MSGCKWPGCPNQPARSGLCADHGQGVPFCRYCLQPIETGRFCSTECQKRDLAAFTIEAADSDERPIPSADQEAFSW